MSYYSVGTGHDVALVDLDLLDPQPTSTGVQATRRVYAASGAIVEEGYYIELVWNVIPSPAVWNSILNQFGVGGEFTAEVTVRVPNKGFAFTRYNGTAVRPDIGKEVVREGYFIRNVKLLVRDLVLAG